MRVLYSDTTFAVLDKPSGLAVHRGSSRDPETMVDLAREALGRYVHPVHRLDRPTSGALLIAFDSDTARTLCQAFASGRVEKRYLAITRGDPGPEGVIDAAVPNDEGGVRVPARTRFWRLGLFEHYELVRAAPETGRFHQLRRHFKHLSCPLIGDTTYGKSEHNRLWRERFGLARLALHCESLAFSHPATGAWLEVQAPPTGPLADAIAVTFGLAAIGLGP